MQTDTLTNYSTFSLKAGDARMEIPVSAQLSNLATQIRDQMQDGPIINSTLTSLELISKFLSLILASIDDTGSRVSSNHLELVANVIDFLETEFLASHEIHAASSDLDLTSRRFVIKTYFDALQILKDADLSRSYSPSALLTASKKRQNVKSFAIFGY